MKWEGNEPQRERDDAASAFEDGLKEAADSLEAKLAEKSPWDTVERPRHYNTGSIQVWDFIVDQGLNYCAGAALKYICRYRHKGRPVEDLKKAVAYLQREIARLESGGAA